MGSRPSVLICMVTAYRALGSTGKLRLRTEAAMPALPVAENARTSPSALPATSMAPSPRNFSKVQYEESDNLPRTGPLAVSVAPGRGSAETEIRARTMVQWVSLIAHVSASAEASGRSLHY